MTQEEIIEMARQAGFMMENSAAIQAAEIFANLVMAMHDSQRTWVGLSDDEIWEAYMESPVELYCSTDELYALSRTVEAKLKRKWTAGDDWFYSINEND